MAYLPPYPESDALPLGGRARSTVPAPTGPEWSVSTVRPPSQLLEYWRVIIANLGWITLVALVGTASGWIYSSFQRPMYQARTVLDIRSLNENFLNNGGASATGATDSVLPEAYIQTEIKILQSESLRKRALAALAGEPQPAVQAPELSFWQSALAWFHPAVMPYKDLIADAGGRVKVRAVGNTRIVEVLCDAQDGQLAASMCKSLADTYIANNLESRTLSTKETSEWLQSQLDDVRRRLTKAENDLKDAGKSTDFGTTSEIAESPSQEKLRQLQAELSRSQAERFVRESNYTIASSRDASSLPSDLDSGPIREYRMRLTDLRRQLAEASATMTPEHYKVRELTMQIADVEKALQSERNGVVNRLKTDLETSMHRESMIAAAYEKQAGQVSMRDDKAVRYNMLKHDVDSERRLYETLLQKVGEVGLTAAMRTSTINIMDPPVAPLRPYSPNRMASMMLGFFGGAGLSLAVCLMRTRSDRTLRVPGETAMHLQVRELGVIPSLRGRGLRLLMHRAKAAAPSLDLMKANGDVVSSSPQTSTMMVPRMPVRSIALATWLRVPEMSEAFFGTMNSLLFGGNDETAARVIVLTSPEDGDGKTTVATNLAIALAQIGRRVVLVDGDLRKPRLHTIFEKSGEHGLAKLLEEDDHTSPRPLDQLVFETQIPNLYVISSKPARDGVSNKLHSSSMRVLLAQLRKEFDLVIIDSPPMMQISDARVLGRLADGVLLVVRARKTTREAALAVHECLLQDGIRVLGTVLNDWNPRKGERYYGTYSSYFRVA